MKTARDVMTSPVLAQPHNSITELAQLLEDQKADGACVMEHGRLVGVVTSMDLVHLKPGEARLVVHLMSVNPVTVLPGATLEHCSEQMFHRHLTMLPVVDADDALLGVVTKDTVLSATGLMHNVVKHHGH